MLEFELLEFKTNEILHKKNITEFKPIEDEIGTFNLESSPSPILFSEKNNHKRGFHFVKNIRINSEE